MQPDNSFLSLENNSQTETGVDYISLQNEEKFGLSAGTVQDRTFKVDFAMGDTSPGKEAISVSLQNGQEPFLREKAASDEVSKLRQEQSWMVRDLISNKANTQATWSDQEVTDLKDFSSLTPIVNPNTVIEELFSKKLFDRVIRENDSPSSVFTRGLTKETTSTLEEVDIASDVLTRKEVATTKLQDLEGKWQETGLLGTVKEYGQQFIPFLSWYLTQNAVKEAKTESLLPGNNLKEQVEHLWLLPKDEFERELTTALSDISKVSTLDAIRFAQAVVSYGSSDELLDNIFGAVDIASVVPFTTIGKMASKGARTAANAARATSALPEVRKAVRDVLKASEGPSLDGVKLAEGSGAIDKAAALSVQKRIDTLAGADELGKGVNLRYNVPSLFNPQHITDNAGSFSREQADRLETTLKAQGGALQKALTNPVNVPRLNEAAELVAIETAKADLTKRYTSLQDVVLNVNHKYDQPSNTYWAEIQVGTKDGDMFKSAKQAQYFGQNIYKLKDNEYRIINQGDGAYISITKPVNETLESVQNTLIETNNRTDMSFANTFFGMAKYLRSSNELSSTFNLEQRLGVLGGSSEIVKYMKEVAQPIANLPDASHKRMMAIFEANRIYVDPLDPTKQGQFFNTLDEFSSFFQSRFNQLPTEQEALAYFSYKQINDFDYVVRNLGLLRDKATQGVERVTIKLRETAGVDQGYSPSFDGVLKETLPDRANAPYRVYLYDGEAGRGVVHSSSRMSDDEYLDLTKRINEDGYKVIQLYDPVQRPIKDLVGSDVVQFVVTKDYETKSLDWQQLPYSGGGHREYVTPFFVKQAKVRKEVDTDGISRHIYEGDVAVFGQETEAEVIKLSRAMDEARLALKEQNGAKLADIVEGRTPFTVRQFVELFTPGKKPNGEVIPPQYDIDQPFKYTKQNQRVVEVDPSLKGLSRFEDMTDSAYNLSAQADHRFTSSRDPVLWTVKENYENGGPTLRLDTARMLDPMASMTRTMRQVMTDRFMNDYKISSINSFMTKYSDLLDGNLDDIQRNPVAFLSNPKWKEVSGDTARLAAAKNEHTVIMNFLSQDTQVGRHLKYVQQKLLDTVYNVGGQRASDFAAESILPKISDPTRFLRAVAFHTKMGMFNPTQIFVQGQTLAHMVALSPTNAYGGWGMGMLSRFAMNASNPEVLNRLGSVAEKVGFSSSKEFIESFQAMRRSGWANVGSETVWASDVMDPTVFNSTAGKFLDKGTVFFKEAEQYLRMSSWNTAYKEWRATNPTAELTDRAINSIRVRADALSVNMTKASQASWERGLLSVPFQFQSYMARLTDQLVGKTLTGQEKARMIGTYSLLYGIPTAGAITTLYPFYEDVRKTALENGYNVSNPVLQGLMEGLPSMVLTQLGLGEWNVAQRYGPGGVTMIKDIIDGDKTALELLLGPSGSITNDVIKSANPIAWNIGKAFTGNFEDLPIAMEDLVGVLRNITTIDNATKILMAHQTGQYITKNGIYVSETTPFNQYVGLITGLTPSEVSDTFIKLDSLADRKDKVAEINKEVGKYLQRYIKDFANNDMDSAEANQRRAKALMIGANFTPQEMQQAFSQGLKGGVLPLVMKINADFWTKAPANQMTDRFNQTNRNNQ